MVPLQSWMYCSTTLTSLPSLEMCVSVGTRVGSFLASIHCDATLLSRSKTLTDDGKPWFDNPEAKDFVRNEIVKKILLILQAQFGSVADGRDKLVDTISQDFEQSFLESRYPSSSSSSLPVTNSMFSTGDLWTGSILVGHPSPNSDAEVEVGLIDWKFASPGRIGQDITQLSAWLYVMFLAGGNSKGRNKRGSRSKGLPGSITTRRGACLTRWREGGPRRAEFEGGNKIEEGEQNRYSD
jgi:hypothetical protein